MKLMNIASGSSGNVSLVATDRTSILVDCGISMKKIEEGLRYADMSGKDIDAVVITHEHSDHIKGLGVISRKYNVPIYTTAGTIKGINECSSVGKIDKELYNVIESDISFQIGDISVTPRSIWHDAYEPVCFSFTDGKSKVSVATDLGNYNDYLIQCLSDSDALLIEANHDVRMLESGMYPYILKQRILSDVGHLSNDTCAGKLSELIRSGTTRLVLAHLSRENNMPALAEQTAVCELNMNGMKRDIDYILKVAPEQGGKMIMY